MSDLLNLLYEVWIFKRLVFPPYRKTAESAGFLLAYNVCCSEPLFLASWSLQNAFVLFLCAIVKSEAWRPRLLLWQNIRSDQTHALSWNFIRSYFTPCLGLSLLYQLHTLRKQILVCETLVTLLKIPFISFWKLKKNMPFLYWFKAYFFSEAKTS